MTAVRYGYTLDGLNRLARYVVVANLQWWPGGDRHDQVDTAWSGIVEHLYAVDDEPTESELLAAGTRALVEDTKGYRKLHGIRDGGTHAGEHGFIGDGPRFAAYWYEPPAEPWDERIIDRMALAQILATAKPLHLDAVGALAATDNYATAAEVLGLKASALSVRLSEARKQFRRHWFAPDTAPPIKGTDRRVGSYAKPLSEFCRNGDGPHEMTPENTQWRAPRKPGRRQMRVCRACEADRSRKRVSARLTSSLNGA